MIGRSLVAAAALGALAAAAPGSTIPPHVQAVMTRDLRFTSAELAELERGRVVRHTLESTAATEVAVVGAVRVNVARQHFLERFRDIERFKRGAEVMEIGRFSVPPKASDLDALTITHEDLDLRRCRIGDCDIRLPAAAITRVQREIDWKARDAEARAAVLFKELLFEHVRAFASGGPGLITQYDDERRPVRPMDDFAALLRASPYVGALDPALPAHLEHLDADPLPAAEDFDYWSKEKFGLTPFITVTHVTIVRPDPAFDLVATRDVYSSRYFDASLSFTIASDVIGNDGAFYLVFANRSRASALKGAFGGLRRAIVERRSRNSVDENLRTTKARLEAK